MILKIRPVRFVAYSAEDRLLMFSERYPFSRASLEGKGLNCPGIYIFWRNKICLYVGKSDRPIYDRLTEHWKSCHNPDLKKWLDVFGKKIEFQWECWDKQIPLLRLEQKYIDHYGPITNKIRAEK